MSTNKTFQHIGPVFFTSLKPTEYFYMQTTSEVIYMQGNPQGQLMALIFCSNTKVTTSELAMFLILNVLSMLTDI